MGSILRGSLVWCLGWVVFSSVEGWAFPLEVAESPGSNLTLTVKAIQSAKNTLAINIYEFTSTEVKDAIIDRIQAGVQVQILEEGQPVGGLSQAARAIVSDVSQAMQAQNLANRYYLMSSKNRTVKRRYRFDHGKYMVIDGKTLLIGSENYSPGGQPLPGNKGNRGWEVLLFNPELAYEYSQVFAQDTDSSHGDVTDFKSSSLANPAGPGVGDDDDDLMSLFSAPDFSSFMDIFSEEHPDSTLTKTQIGVQSQPGTPVEADELLIAKLSADTAQRVTSPDSSLSGLLALIEAAHTSLDIELMTFDYKWGNDVSPLYTAVVDAAKRGVKVRVLLNDERAFSSSAKQKNLITVNALNEAAQSEGLDLSAAIANLKAMKVKIIHNKGTLVDGDTTLVSSINWNKNSVQNNREAAVVLKSSAVHDYYLNLFEKDWKASQ